MKNEIEIEVLIIQWEKNKIVSIDKNTILN